MARVRQQDLNELLRAYPMVWALRFDQRDRFRQRPQLPTQHTVVEPQIGLGAKRLRH
jgi:hypothetical protein